jgi:hypothetical protein
MTQNELLDTNFQALMSGQTNPEAFQTAPAGGEGGGDPAGGAAPAGGEGGGDPAGAAAAGNDNGGGAAAATQWDWEKETGGMYKTADDFKADFEAFRNRRETLNSVFGQLENPIHPSLSQVNAVMKTFEIEDLSVAQKLAATSKEALEADPVLAIAVKKIYATPSLLKSTSFETVAEAVKEEYGYQGEDSEGKPIFTQANRLAVDKSGALLEIDAKKAELSKNNIDIFAKAEANRTEHKTKVAAAQTAWQEPAVKDRLTAFVNQIKQVNGEQALNYNPSQELVKKAQDHAASLLVNQGELPTEEGLTKFNQIARAYLAINDLPNIIQAAKSMTEAQATEFANRFFHNGTPIARKSEASQQGNAAADQDAYYKAILNAPMVRQ